MTHPLLAGGASPFVWATVRDGHYQSTTFWQTSDGWGLLGPPTWPLSLGSIFHVLRNWVVYNAYHSPIEIQVPINSHLTRSSSWLELCIWFYIEGIQICAFVLCDEFSNWCKFKLVKYSRVVVYYSYMNVFYCHFVLFVIAIALE